jgi:hypothetical protein
MIRIAYCDGQPGVWSYGSIAYALAQLTKLNAAEQSCQYLDQVATTAFPKSSQE